MLWYGYKSVAKDEENCEISISEGSQNSSTVDNVTNSHNGVVSSKMTLEKLKQFSKHLNTNFRTPKHGKSVLPTGKRGNLSPVYTSKCIVDTTSSTSSHQETNLTVDIQNGTVTLNDEADLEDLSSTRCSENENGYERVDGYESGVNCEQSERPYLCIECRKLYKKARKNKHAAEVLPKKREYSHWRTKFWMMMNRIPSQKRNKRKKEQNRTLNRVLRKIKTNRQTGSYLRCCRIHSFLKRNLRLCTTTKKLFHSPNARLKRKRPTYARKSSQKSKAKRKESLSCSIEKKNTKKSFVLMLDSSEEEDTRPNVKRYKLLSEDMKLNILEKSRENPVSKTDVIVEPINICEQHNTPVQKDIIDFSDTEDEDLGTFNQSFYTLPQDTDGSLDATGSSVFSHVQGGSFKELLQRMNSGYFRSGIIRENQL
ncbi:uncharacterized protein ACMZJ9_010349 isoform 2-T2 [Mantella aurantiaca]